MLDFLEASGYSLQCLRGTNGDDDAWAVTDGANGVIDFDGTDRATGQWSLLFHNINLASRTLTQMGVEYEDRYVKADGRWWIAETRSRRLSCLIHAVDADGRPIALPADRVVPPELAPPDLPIRRVRVPPAG